MAKSFVKWLGGKRRLCTDLEDYLPKKVNNYFEPMVGGGAFFFYLQERNLFKRAILGDLLTELMITYLAVRDDLPRLIKQLEKHAPHTGYADYYLKLRQNQDLIDPIDIAARMIYLNKSCFNGMHRVNSHGEFNVPHGGCGKAGVLNNLAFLSSCSKALQGTHIATGSYERTTRAAMPGDFIYVDPPYLPLSKTANFTAFSGRFDFQEHERLEAWARSMAQRGVSIVLSNHDTEVAREIYKDPIWKLNTIEVQRNIAADGGKRVRVKELIIQGVV